MHQIGQSQKVRSIMSHIDKEILTFVVIQVIDLSVWFSSPKLSPGYREYSLVVDKYRLYLIATYRDIAVRGAYDF
jgi:hypothetical protein